MASPMYRTIAEDLREQIEAGLLTPGAQLPTETELRARYAASRNTVRDAIRLLASLGLVEGRPGQGTFVSRKIDPLFNIIGPHSAGEVSGYAAKVASGGRRAVFTPLQVAIQQPPARVARELRLQASAEVISRHQQRLIDGSPWSMQTAFYPRSLANRGATKLLATEDMPTGMLAYLEDELGIRPETWRIWLTARQPDEHEAQFFMLRTGVAVAETLQTYYDQTGTPYCLAITMYPADRNLFRITAGSTPQLDELHLDCYFRCN